MAEVKKDALKAAKLREIKPEERAKLLAEKQAELLEKKRALQANELANPRSITKLRREIALIKTVENEPRGEEETK